ncbi:MAG TPA: M48 family metallopeptidase [Terriglobales bacterium]|nr:M48 family metallopeptidase [Terriglobales bacterium]
MAQPLLRKVLVLLLVLLLSPPTWLEAVTPGPELPNPGSTGMSKQQQEQLGLKAVAEVYKQMPVLPDSSPVTKYVQELGRRLVPVIPQQYSWPYQFHVIQQKEINAFALPGGPIFVNVGTITAADNEAELAGVMAHEMSHVYMQHSAKAAPKQTWANVLGALGGMLGGGAIGTLARMGIQLGAGSLLLKYSRHDEAQADEVGAIIMYKAGFDPRAMAQFFQKLEKQGGSGGPQFLSDHPNPGNRVAAVDKEIADWPPKNFVHDSPDFARARQEAAAVKSYTAQQIQQGAQQGVWARQNQQSGAVPPNLPAAESGGAQGGGQITNVSYREVQPSGRFKQLQLNGFAISYPDNWQEHTSSQQGVLIAPAAGVSAGAIAYGVIVNAAQDSNANTLDQATQDLIQSLQQSNPDLQVTGRPSVIRVNGVEGRSVDLLGSSPVEQNGQPLRERDWLVTLPRGQGGLLYLIFISPENDFSRLRPTFEKMLDSVRLQ